MVGSREGNFTQDRKIIAFYKYSFIVKFFLSLVSTAEILDGIQRIVPDHEGAADEATALVQRFLDAIGTPEHRTVPGLQRIPLSDEQRKVAEACQECLNAIGNAQAKKAQSDTMPLITDLYAQLGILRRVPTLWCDREVLARQSWNRPLNYQSAVFIHGVTAVRMRISEVTMEQRERLHRITDGLLCDCSFRRRASLDERKIRQGWIGTREELRGYYRGIYPNDEHTQNQKVKGRLWDYADAHGFAVTEGKPAHHPLTFIAQTTYASRHLTHEPPMFFRTSPQQRFSFGYQDDSGEILERIKAAKQQIGSGILAHVRKRS